jgi:peptidoglycan/xylan/chitin deacetylase (PgdA/CDA1 family)
MLNQESDAAVRKLRAVLSVGVAVLLLAACGMQEASLPAPTEPLEPTETAPTEASPTPDLASESAPTPTEVVPTPTEAPPTPTPDPALAFVGHYRFRPPHQDETADYFLELKADRTALIEEIPVGSTEVAVDASGTWSVDGDAVLLDITRIHGEPATQEEMLHVKFDGGFPTVSDIEVGDEFVHLENAAFSLGAGEQHPLVQELNRRLAAVDYLGFTDPDSDVYNEQTRQAVVAFQESQGLLPNGVLDAETWLLLDNPLLPLPTPTPLPTAGPITGVPNLDDLPSHTDEGQPILYLTFDDGPQPGNTPALLELLDQYDTQVTFFNVGSNVKKHPELVRDCATARHYIADHTWDHASFEGMSHDKFVNEVERTRQAILDAAGDLLTLDHNVRYVRPPYGATDANTRQFAAELGMTIVLWNVDTQDWRRPGAEAISRHLLSHAGPGLIVLMHDGGGDRSQTIAALKTALPQLQQQGYVFRNIFLP